MITTRETRRAWIIMILLMFIWGYSWITAKIALRYASPLDASVIRLVLGTLFLFAFLVWSKATLRPLHIKWLIIAAALALVSWLTIRRQERIEPMMAQE